MPDLLLELFSEEIPARMQPKAAEDLKALVTNALVDRGLTYDGARAFSTPRRLALSIHGLPARQPDLTEEKKGPRVGAPQQAIDGFLKSAGLASLDQAKIESDPKKGEFYVAVTKRVGRPAIEVLAEVLPQIIRDFPWPKSMRWGKASRESGALRWVRPLHSILATFGPETEEPEVVAFEIGGISSGNTTRGHRFMAPGEIRVRRLEDWMASLAAAKVVVDPERRKDLILTEAKSLAFAQGLELVEDAGLLEEISGLVEWPVVLMGEFEPEFLKIPDEVIRATIRINQKCFVLRDPKTGRLANRFIMTSNIEAKDGGAAIIAGAGRVIRARLSDAKFFYETDLKTRLEDRLAKFESIVFHEKLGTQAARIARIEALAAEIAPLVGADVELTKHAARLAKADLLTEVVGEFPEVQGLMGRKYAEAQGEHASVAAACEEHYKPQGPSDRTPTDPVSVAVALADKLDILVGFWAINEKPTGSKDPYALRRAALGMLRLVIDNKLRFQILPITLREFDRRGIADATDRAFDLLSFFNERLKVQLRDSGARHDLVDAVTSAGMLVDHGRSLNQPASDRSLVGKYPNDMHYLIVRRVEALGALLDTEDGKNLLAGYRRAANILKAEEKKDGDGAFDGAPDAALLVEPEEKALAHALEAVTHHVADHVTREDFAGAMKALAELRPAVDAFFDKVLVNADDKAVRANRLRLLAGIRAATAKVADFGRIAG